jgi:hypothetical protein
MSEGSTEQTEDEPIYFSYSATLRIFGVITDFDAVTRTLGLQPTHFHRAGERRTPRRMPYDHDQWSYRAPVPSERPLHVHIDTLWSHIQPHRDYLLSLKERLTGDVFEGAPKARVRAAGVNPVDGRIRAGEFRRLRKPQCYESGNR